MINVKGTIYKSIVHLMKQLRRLANNDTTAFKHIISLIVLDDMLDWADYLDAPQSVQKCLKDKRLAMIRKFNFKTVNDCKESHFYVNVNLPQSTYTWLRVFDNPEVMVITSPPTRINTSSNDDTNEK